MGHKKGKELQWISNCGVCNVGLVNAVGEKLANADISIAAAAKQVYAEILQELGEEVLTPLAIEKRYRHIKGLRKDWETMAFSGSEIKAEFAKTLKYLRTATNKLCLINPQLAKMNATEISGLEGLLAKIDIALFVEQFSVFSKYFKIQERVADEKGKQRNKITGS